MEIGPRREALSRFVERLAMRSALSAVEADLLLNLPGSPELVATHRDFVQLGKQVDHACLVASGIAGRFAQLQDGSRQTIAFHIPGDMADLHSLMMPKAPMALHALTAVTILKVPHAALRDAAAKQSNIAAAFWRDCVLDGNIIAQWLVNVGRRDALARLAHLLCEMAVRIGRTGAPARLFTLPITQEQLADALGLTPVHVNRTLRALRESKLATVTRHQKRIDDWNGLASVGEFNPAYLALPEEPAAGVSASCG